MCAAIFSKIIYWIQLNCINKSYIFERIKGHKHSHLSVFHGCSIILNKPEMTTNNTVALKQTASRYFLNGKYQCKTDLLTYYHSI